MSDRGKAKPRRDGSSARYFHQQCGYDRAPTSRGVEEAGSSRVSPEGERGAARPNAQRIETQTMIRFDGDSIAYFWALESETSLSHATLTMHWREFTDVLTNAWRLG